MSLFNRPAWAKTQAAEEADENIFSHSKRSAEIFADEQRRKKEREEKLRRKAERKERRVSAKREMREEQSKKSGSSPKRRRITLEEGEDLYGLSPPRPVGEADHGAGEVIEDVGLRRSPRTNKTAARDNARFAPPAPPVVIELGGDSPELDDDVQFCYVELAPPAPARVPVEDESDDEFAELARQARAQKRLREESAKKSQTPDAKSPTPGQDALDRSRTACPTPPLPDPAVALFISSQIPGTNPLVVYRKLSQRLQEIRKVWCDKQGFTKGFAEGVFLIYRMRRVFDVTTCRSLGLEADADGKVTMKGAEGVEGFDKVHLEAVTAEIFAQLKAEKEAEERARQNGGMPEYDAQAGVAGEEAPVEERLIRVLLRAKNVSEPYKLRVKPSTIISKIVTACRAYEPFKVSEKQQLYLDFDGEHLDPDSKIEDTDIEDMECIHVHIS